MIRPAVLMPAFVLIASATGACKVKNDKPGAGAMKCADDNGGIRLPDGFCAGVFTDEIKHPRHIVVAENGDVYVAEGDALIGPGKGGLWGLRDDDGDGDADQVERIFEGGGNGVALDGDTLYFARHAEILRFTLQGGALVPGDAPVVVVGGLPADGDHYAKTVVVDGDSLVVNCGSASNSCQVGNRENGSPGMDPCGELETRAGLWRFDKNGVDQAPSDGTRIATGVRNGNALARDPNTGKIVAAVNGRDQLHENWPDIYSEDDDKRLPAETVLVIDEGSDYGWPFCYFDPDKDSYILAPEYGGNGDEVGRCADIPAPDLVLPAHWAPLAMEFIDDEKWPERWRGGALVSFHGARFDAPKGADDEPGYEVDFMPFVDGKPTDAIPFASGFAGNYLLPLPLGATHRAVGLAHGNDGNLYIGDDQGGRIWNVVVKD